MIKGLCLESLSKGSIHTILGLAHQMVLQGDTPSQQHDIRCEVLK